MIYIDKEHYPAKGLKEKILSLITIFVILFVSMTMFLKVNSFKDNSVDFLIGTTNYTEIDTQKMLVDVEKIADEKGKQYKDIAEIDSWSFDKDEFIAKLGAITVTENGKTDIEDIASSSISFKFNQYNLKIDDDTTFYFTSKEDAEKYKKKIDIDSKITTTKVAKVQKTSQKKLDEKYDELMTPVVIAREKVQVTTRGGSSVRVNSSYKGILPLTNYVYISSYYRSASRPSHTGVDYAASYGTKIKAFQSGKVVKASWSGGYGMCIEIDHGNGMKTRYAHCSGYNVNVGDYVSQGDIIGFVGSTGNSTGNHLHFEVIINGNFQNPLNYIS